jgi:hypothetical protein
LTSLLNTSKCDQAGNHGYWKRFFFSDDVDLCFVTALGKKILTTPPECAGPFVYRSNVKSTASGPVQTFERKLKAMLRAMLTTGEISANDLGVPIAAITLHSLKRTAYRYLRNFSLPIGAIKARAEHRDGLEHVYAGRDEGPNPNDDATMGRLLAGFQFCTERFYVVPPHFGHAHSSRITYERIVPMYMAMQNPSNSSTMKHFNKILPHFLAAVLHHYHGSNKGLASTDKLFQSPMWTTQVAYRSNLYNWLKGGGRESSSIKITLRNREQDIFMMMHETRIATRAIFQHITQGCKPAVRSLGRDDDGDQHITQGCKPAVRSLGCNDDGDGDGDQHVGEQLRSIAISDGDAVDYERSSSATSDKRILDKRCPPANMDGWGSVLQQTTTQEYILRPMQLFDMFIRYYVGVRGHPPMRHFKSHDIPRHLTCDQKSNQRSLLSKAHFVFTGLLGQTDPLCIDGNNACRVYEKLKNNVTRQYGRVITQGTVRTAYNKMTKDMEAYKRCCVAPSISLEPPRQQSLEESMHIRQQPMEQDDNICDTDDVLSIDDEEQSCVQEDETEKCLVCPYCDDDVLHTYRTRKTLLEHVRTGHEGCQPPASNIVKVVASQKVGRSSNSRWIRVQNALARIEQPAVVITDSPKTGKPANLSATILKQGELRSGTFVQVFNASPKELWFALVVDGRILGKDSDSPRLVCAHWCKPNCLQPDPCGRKDTIFLATIIAMGCRDTLSKLCVQPAKTHALVPRCILDFFSPVRSRQSIRHESETQEVADNAAQGTTSPPSPASFEQGTYLPHDVGRRSEPAFESVVSGVEPSDDLRTMMSETHEVVDNSRISTVACAVSILAAQGTTSPPSSASFEQGTYLPDDVGRRSEPAFESVVSDVDPLDDLRTMISEERELIARLRHSNQVLPLNERDPNACERHRGSVHYDFDTENKCLECKVDEHLLQAHFNKELCNMYPQHERNQTKLHDRKIGVYLLEPHVEFISNARKMKTIKNVGGGNCLFHSLVQGLSHLKMDTPDHLQLRQQIIDHASSHFDRKVFTKTHNERGPTALQMPLRELFCHKGNVVVSRPFKKPAFMPYNCQEQYFDIMRKAGTWGEEFEIASAAMLLGVCIHIFSPSRSLQPFQFFAPGNNEDASHIWPENHIYLLNRDGLSHYECLAGNMDSEVANGTPETARKRPRSITSMAKDICASKCNFVSVPGNRSSKFATQEQSQLWWQDALALCPSITQDPKSFAWIRFVKDSRETERQNGSLLPESFQVLLREAISQHQGDNLNFLDLGSEAGMALWHFMLHPKIGMVTGIEIDEFWYDVSVKLLSSISERARQENVHVAKVVLIKQDFLCSDKKVNDSMATADIVYSNNVQFDKKKKAVPSSQRTVPNSHPFKTLVNTNLAAKLYENSRREKMVLALFEYAAFQNKITKKVKSLQLQPTWGHSKTDVTLLIYQKNNQLRTPKRDKKSKEN